MEIKSTGEMRENLGKIWGCEGGGGSGDVYQKRGSRMVGQRRFGRKQQATPCIAWAGVKEIGGGDGERGEADRDMNDEEVGQNEQSRPEGLGKAVEERCGVGNERQERRIGETTQ